MARPPLVALVVLAGTFSLAGPVAADVAVYADALGAGWANWSWSATVNLANASPVHGGSASIATTYAAGWAGLYLHVAPALDGALFRAVRFAIHGGAAGGQHLRLMAYDAAGASYGSFELTAPSGSWSVVEVPLSSLDSPPTVGGLVWQDTTGGAQPTFFVDDVTLIAWTVPPTPTPPPTPGVGPAIAVNATAGAHLISEDIYGMNYADEALAAELRLGVRRWGGNSTSRYNWTNDTTNTGSDWYFENVPNEVGAADRFVEQDRRTGARTIMTVPLVGWVAKQRPAGHPYDCGFKVSVYGAQQSTDPWDPDCGNGVRTDGGEITGNDPADTSIAIDPSFVTGWIAHLVARFGDAVHGGVAYVDLDNEPMLWPDTHRDVHPQPTSYDEMRDRTWAYAAAVKEADPTVRTMGPVVWGWTAYFWSALDWAGGGSWWLNPPDRLAHGNVPFVEWYLQQMRAYEVAHGRRILDLVDVHFYPPGVALAAAGNAATQALRLRSTRLLWDRTYSEESWIGEPVYLVPRMHDWVAADYPGTGLAVTEYNWGALDHLNGALAQADVLGIFGRERLDVATLWGPPAASDPGAFAFRMFRNVDGAGHGFGELGAFAASADEGRLSAYAARRVADGRLTVMVVNKTADALTSTVTVESFVPSGSAEVWRYSAADLGAIVREADATLAAGALTTTFPASSITLLVIPGGAGPLPSLPGRRPRRALSRR
ncbi:MAG: glycoside hydrolase family 44 protein [Acidobacteria bacterium]|nr:glycoside hydrolase family 44 protein [Acidobacteriota bacterium]